MGDKFRFGLNRIKERLWVKPLLICALSITGAFLAKMADHTGIERLLPDITPDSIQTLLKIISASMLVIATLRWPRWSPPVPRPAAPRFPARSPSSLPMTCP